MGKLWQLIKSQEAMAILAIAGFGFAIYQTYFFEKRGQISITADRPARVFDVLQPIGGLDISYAGENLRSSKKALWILRVTVKNTGNAEIRKGDFDESAPLGLLIDGGQIVDSPTVQTAVEYLQKNLNIKSSRDRLLFSPVILEPDESFQVVALVLGPENTLPRASALGKIAGMKSISVNPADGPQTDESLVVRVTGASSWWIQILRIPIYGIGGLIGLLLLAAVGAAIGSPFQILAKKRDLAKRRIAVADYRQGEDLSKDLRFLIDQYVNRGDGALLSAVRVYECLEKRLSLHEKLSNVFDGDDLKKKLQILAPLEFDDRGTMDRMLKQRVLSYDGPKPIFASTAAKDAAELCVHLHLDPSKAGDYRDRFDRSFNYLAEDSVLNLTEEFRREEEINKAMKG